MAQPDDDELSLSASSMSGVDEEGEVPDEASSQQAGPCSRWDLSGIHGAWKDFLLVRSQLSSDAHVCERPTAYNRNIPEHLSDAALFSCNRFKRRRSFAIQPGIPGRCWPAS